MTVCPVCDGEITLEEGTEVNEIIICDDCGTELEVTGSDSVQEAPEVEEDWGQ